MAKTLEQDEVVPFVDELLPKDCKHRALLTWKTLRALSYPTGLGHSIAPFRPETGEIAYAVMTTKVRDVNDIPFDVYEMVLIALGRQDVLQHMQQEEFQIMNAVDT